MASSATPVPVVVSTSMRKMQYTVPKELAGMVPLELVPYKEARSMDIVLSRSTEYKSSEDEVTSIATTLRAALGMVPTLRLTFDLDKVELQGKAVIYDNLRDNLHNMIVKQQAGMEFELYAYNHGTKPIRIMSSSIIEKGSKKGAPWHGIFPPTACIGILEPASSITINRIYMQLGSTFTPEVDRYEGGVNIEAPDRPYFHINGHLGYYPDILTPDGKNFREGVDPYTDVSNSVRLVIQDQPYSDPRTLYSEAVAMLVKNYANISAAINGIPPDGGKSKERIYKATRFKYTRLHDNHATAEFQGYHPPHRDP